MTNSAKQFNSDKFWLTESIEQIWKNRYTVCIIIMHSYFWLSFCQLYWPRCNYIQNITFYAPYTKWCSWIGKNVENIFTLQNRVSTMSFIKKYSPSLCVSLTFSHVQYKCCITICLWCWSRHSCPLSDNTWSCH